MNRWMNLMDLSIEELDMMSNYLHTVPCPNPDCFHGLVPDEDREPVSVEIFPGFGLIDMPIKPCNTCDGKGWMFAISNN
jgi:hypothetical protein